MTENRPTLSFPPELTHVACNGPSRIGNRMHVSTDKGKSCWDWDGYDRFKDCLTLLCAGKLYTVQKVKSRGSCSVAGWFCNSLHKVLRSRGLSKLIARLALLWSFDKESYKPLNTLEYPYPAGASMTTTTALHNRDFIAGSSRKPGGMQQPQLLVLPPGSRNELP